MVGGFPGGSVIKNPPANAGDARDRGSIPGSGRSHGEGNGNPLQYSCLENPMDRGPGGLQSIGTQRAGHDWNDLAHTHTLGKTLLLREAVWWVLRNWPTVLFLHLLFSIALFPNNVKKFLKQKRKKERRHKRFWCLEHFEILQKVFHNNC